MQYGRIQGNNMDAWNTLINHSYAQTGSDAWTHLNSQRHDVHICNILDADMITDADTDLTNDYDATIITSMNANAKHGNEAFLVSENEANIECQ